MAVSQLDGGTLETPFWEIGRRGLIGEPCFASLAPGILGARIVAASAYRLAKSGAVNNR